MTSQTAQISINSLSILNFIMEHHFLSAAAAAHFGSASHPVLVLSNKFMKDFSDSINKLYWFTVPYWGV